MKKQIVQLSLASMLGMPIVGLAQSGPSVLSAPDGSPTNALVVDNNGNIGIGTTNPLRRLHVVGTGIFDEPGGAIRVPATKGVIAPHDLGIWNPNSGVGSTFAIGGWDTPHYVSINTSNGNFGVSGRVYAPQFYVVGSASDQLTFSHAGNTVMMHHYGLSVGPHINGIGPVVGISGFGGVGLFSGGLNRLFVDASGRIGINTLTPQATLDVAGQVSCTTLALTSDPLQKLHFEAVSPKEIVAKVATLPVTTWAYTNSPGVRHIGPMSTDFRDTFNLGEDDKHISAVDGIGVSLAAIKGLHELVQEKDARIAALESKLANLEGRLNTSLATLDRLSDQVAKHSSKVGVSAALQ